MWRMQQIHRQKKRLSSGTLPVHSLMPRRWTLCGEASPEVCYSSLGMLQRADNYRTQSQGKYTCIFNSCTRLCSQRTHPPKDIQKHTNYLPMCRVVKEASTTTKLHVVFDASAKTSSGVSSNDQLLSGPNLYPHLASMILAF